MAIIVLSSSTLLAETKKTKTVAQTSKSTDKTMSELGKIDAKTLDVAPEPKSKEITDDMALYTKPNNVKVNFSCKTRDGHEIKQGEKGYDECLQKVKNDKNNPHDPNADIKVNFGN